MPERDIDSLMLRYLDGLVTPDEVDAMNQQLQRDPEAQDRFIDLTLRYALLHDALQGVQGSGFRVQDEDPTTPTLRTSRWRRVRSVWYAAALIALAVTAWFVFFPEPRTQNPEPSTTGIALLTNVSHAIFADGSSGSQQPQLGAELEAGTISLVSGSAQVMFHSGAVVDLRGPCTFAMTEPNRGHLVRGTLNAYVPDAAHGFTIGGPHGVRVIDLGTRFAMHVDAAGASDVRVLKGTVMVEVERPDAEKRYALLTANQRVHVDPTVSLAEALRVIERTPIAEAVEAADFRVDFELAIDGARTSDGFAGMSMPADRLDKSELPFSKVIPGRTALAGELTVSIDTEDDSALDFRHRGASSHPKLAGLLEDQVKNQNGGLSVTLSNLPAGLYRVVSWHHDAGGGAAGNTFDVRVSDAQGSRQLMAVDLMVSSGLGAAEPTVADFDLLADGEHPVTILYSPTSEDRETPCNGLTLTRLDAPGVSTIKPQ